MCAEWHISITIIITVIKIIFVDYFGSFMIGMDNIDIILYYLINILIKERQKL